MDNFNNTLQLQRELQRCGLSPWGSAYVVHVLLGVTDPMEAMILLLAVEDGGLAELDVELLQGFGTH